MNDSSSNDASASSADPPAVPDRAVPGPSFPEYIEQVAETGRVRAGVPLPLGVHMRGEGANFALLSRHATRVLLEFYDAPTSASPSRVFVLSSRRHRTGSVWHIWVDDVTPGQLYGYRVDGPYLPHEGHRYNPHKLLLDPYATAITHLQTWDFRAARGYDMDSPRQDLSFSTVDNAGRTPKCVVTDEPFDWEDDRRPRHPWSKTVIYETHVRGLTIHDSSGVDHPGTFRGLIEKIPYLQDLGVTAVELMPVQEFNEYELARQNPMTEEPLRNYWGYNPTAMMAPNGAYSSSGSQGQQTIEFKEMVKALHAAGIEIILDVVLNHTAEANELGPTFCWRGIDNPIYYILAEDPRFYKDYTGTGNTIKADQPIVRDFILDILRYWAVEMHVDGFRFDLASVLGRDQDGALLADPPLIERIAEDPVLGEVKMIAEAWDAAGAYQVGSFFRRRWAEWNGRFRDDVRRFWRGDPGFSGEFAHRLCGSDDLYRASGKGPDNSINYITCHDGFTLNDLVSYNRKHNEANGEFNRDGPSVSYSANYGDEGSTSDSEIQAVRARQIKNFFVTLFLSRGVPMLLGGDEFRRTQQGNNNAYCQDNDISWYNWTRKEAHEGTVAFVRALTSFRAAHPVLTTMEYYAADEVRWFDASGERPSWQGDRPNRLGCMIRADGGTSLLFAANAHPDPVPFRLPAEVIDGSWWVRFDTAEASPDDALDRGVRPLAHPGGAVAMKGFACLVAEAA